MQTIVVPDQPATPPLIDASTARARLGLSAGVNDATIDAFVAAATSVLDGPDGWLGRALAKRQLELQTEFFPGAWPGLGYWSDYARCYAPDLADLGIKLLCPPVISVDSISYVDGNGAQQTLAPSAYELHGRRLTPVYGTSWPAARYQPGAIRVRYTAGYEAGKVPAPIIQAIVLQVATMNAMTKADPLLSQDTVIGVSSQSWATADVGAAYDRAAQALLAPYRVID